MDVEKLMTRAVVNTEPMFSAYLHSKANASGVPVSATFELTARCNFNCKMCYVHLAQDQLKGAQLLTVDQWKDILYRPNQGPNGTDSEQR